MKLKINGETKVKNPSSDASVLGIWGLLSHIYDVMEIKLRLLQESTPFGVERYGVRPHLQLQQDDASGK
jgi:hypothetical protein